jgi:glucose-6-phosphate 1-dehydrogenase
MVPLADSFQKHYTKFQPSTNMHQIFDFLSRNKLKKGFRILYFFTEPEPNIRHQGDSPMRNHTHSQSKGQAKRQTPPLSIIIFGASGDLTHRKLIPALYSLACDDLLSSNTRVIGVGRTEFTDAAFREQLRNGVEDHARLKPGDISANWDPFSQHISYLIGDYDDKATYNQINQRLQEQQSEVETGGNRLFHMAIPPSLFKTVVHNLGQAGLNHSENGWTRIVVEKPFGKDQESAHQLNHAIHKVFKEDQVFRIDHYLGKETVQNLLTLRFANAIFEPIWNRNYIDHVQISVAERVGVGKRAGYYDQAGILRDMFQNHVMQLLALTAIEPPVAFEAETFRNKKTDVLRAVRPIDRNLRGQYTGRKAIQAYRQEQDVPPDSTTATFAALRLFIDNWRWKNVPFYLRSGKRLATKSTSIAIEFKQVPHLMFPLKDKEKIPPNILYLCLQPNEGINLRLQTKQPGAGMATHSADIDYAYAQDFEQRDLPDAYERLLLDAIQGDATLFTRADEIELAWQIIDPVVKSWQSKDGPACHRYQPLGWGPEAADRFIEQDGRRWHYGCGE